LASLAEATLMAIILTSFSNPGHGKAIGGDTSQHLPYPPSLDEYIPIMYSGSRLKV
jgi:hypothetical protein